MVFFCFINFCPCRRFRSYCNLLNCLIVFSLSICLSKHAKKCFRTNFFSSVECLERVYWTVFLLLSGVASCSLIFVFSALLSGSWVLLHISWVYGKFFFFFFEKENFFWFSWFLNCHLFSGFFLLLLIFSSFAALLLLGFILGKSPAFLFQFSRWEFALADSFVFLGSLICF